MKGNQAGSQDPRGDSRSLGARPRSAVTWGWQTEMMGARDLGEEEEKRRRKMPGQSFLRKEEAPSPRAGEGDGRSCSPGITGGGRGS